MAKDDDTAALIERAQRQIAEWDQRYLASHGARVPFVALAADLAAALSRAQADAARMRSALEQAAHSHDRGEPAYRAWEIARAALEPRHD